MRVLILEDDALISLDLAMMLEESGHEVVGPYSNCEAVLNDLEKHAPDFGLLDFNIRDTTSEHVAEAFDRQNIPYAFLTGMGRQYLPEKYRDAKIIEKPVMLGTILRVMDPSLNG